MSDTVLLRDRRAGVPIRRRLRLDWRVLSLAAAAVIGVSAALGYGYHWWSVGRFLESTDDAYVGGDVTVIAPKVAGFIAEVAITDNQPVHAGDLLVRLDDRDYRAALARAEAAVAGEQATLDNLAATRRLQQSLILQAQAETQSAQAEIERAREDEVRYRTLSSHAAASTQSFERAEATLKEALASGAKSRAALAASQRELEVIDTRERQTQAALAAALAERQTARLNLSYTELRAPIDGTVGNRSARIGQFATVGVQLLSLVPARGLWVDANFKESQLAHIRPGDAAVIRADVLPRQVFRGRVASLAPATGAQFSVLPAENATGNFTKIVQRVPVRILLERDDGALGRLRPGLSVTAQVDVREAGSEPQ